MDILEQGNGSIFSTITPDEFRSHMRAKSDRANNDKRMDLKEAIKRFVKIGDYISLGGCSIVRTPIAFVHEVLRQGYHFRMAAGTRTFDVDLLLDNDRIMEMDIGYILGLEMLGIPQYTRTRVKERLIKGELKITEWSNGTMAWRHKAAAMGLPFLPVRSLAGTDTFKQSAGKKVKCPFTGIDVILVPALYCDVSIIHVHRADKYGNCQIDGMLNEDLEKARSAKNLIITTEKIIDTDEIREGRFQNCYSPVLCGCCCGNSRWRLSHEYAGIVLHGSGASEGLRQGRRGSLGRGTEELLHRLCIRDKRF